MVTAPAARRRPRTALVWALAVFALAAALTFAGRAVADRLARGSLRTQTTLIAHHVGARVHACVTTRIEMVEQLRREWALGGLQDDAAFGHRIDALIATFPGYLAINRIEDGGVIAQVYPVVANLAALGRKLDETPVAEREYRDAIATGEPHITPPIQLFQGGTGLALYVPTGAAGEASQLVFNGVFRAETLIDACLGPDGTGTYSLELRDGPLLIFARAGVPDAPAYATETTLRMLDRRWTLRMSPARVHVASAHEPGRVIVGTGLALAGMLGTLVFFLVAYRDRVRAQREQAAAQRAEERRRVEAKLAQVHRMQALGQLASAVAHDFNNLLTIITTSAHLAREARSPEDRATATREIQDAARRGAALTHELVLFGRGDERPPAPLDLGAVVGALRNLVTRLAGPAITVDVRVPDARAMILGSPVQVEQILVNLATNAIAAMPDGGTLAFTITATADAVVLRVEDTGTGIPPDVLPRIFEPFFTTKAVDVGTGLGLATVYGHVQRMDGEIAVESTPGAGTRFTIRFPALRGA